VLIRLMMVLQTTAFPFRHCTVGSRSRSRTADLRFQRAMLCRLS
jgi:hypothetical protein